MCTWPIGGWGASAQEILVGHGSHRAVTSAAPNGRFLRGVQPVKTTSWIWSHHGRLSLVFEAKQNLLCGQRCFRSTEAYRSRGEPETARPYLATLIVVEPELVVSRGGMKEGWGSPLAVRAESSACFAIAFLSVSTAVRNVRRRS